MDEKDIKFIAERYRPDKFAVDRGWNALNIKPSPFIRRVRIAAAIACVAVISATAAALYHHYNPAVPPAHDVVDCAATANRLHEVRVIDFENAPLTTVIARIQEVYGVEIADVPDNADNYMLSLHYEGNAPDLVATINEILETRMKVKE